MSSTTTTPVKKPRKPRTKKADMIKIKEEKAKQMAIDKGLMFIVLHYHKPIIACR